MRMVVLNLDQFDCLLRSQFAAEAGGSVVRVEVDHNRLRLVPVESAVEVQSGLPGVVCTRVFEIAEVL